MAYYNMCFEDSIFETLRARSFTSTSRFRESTKHLPDQISNHPQLKESEQNSDLFVFSDDKFLGLVIE